MIFLLERCVHLQRHLECVIHHYPECISTEINRVKILLSNKCSAVGSFYMFLLLYAKVDC